MPCSKRSGAAYAKCKSCLSGYLFLGCVHGQEIGAKTIDLEWVQVHPTGLVKPDDADAKIKFLAAEATACTRARPCFCVLLGPPRCGRHHPERGGQPLLQRAGPPGTQGSVVLKPRSRALKRLLEAASSSQAATTSLGRCGRASRPSGAHVVSVLYMVASSCLLNLLACGFSCRLCLNKAASDEIIWHCKPYPEHSTPEHKPLLLARLPFRHYTGRGARRTAFFVVRTLVSLLTHVVGLGRGHT